MVGARVNGKLVNIDYVIQNGDRIEIMTSQNSKGPSRDWLNIIKEQPGEKQDQRLVQAGRKADNILKGNEMIDRYCKAKGINFSDINKPEFVDKVLKRYAFQDWDSVLASVGHGGLKRAGHQQDDRGAQKAETK